MLRVSCSMAPSGLTLAQFCCGKPKEQTARMLCFSKSARVCGASTIAVFRRAISMKSIL
jgi:hypothetical protein